MVSVVVVSEVVGTVDVEVVSVVDVVEVVGTVDVVEVVVPSSQCEMTRLPRAAPS